MQPRVQIVYATITGNNEEVAGVIADAFEDLGADVTMTEISQTDVSAFTASDICIVCPYTYDDGALPEEGLDFYDDLATVDLSGKIFGVAGSGDTFYGEFFCTAVEKFDEALAATGAQRGSAPVKINLAPDNDEAIDQLDAFANNIMGKFTATG